MKKLLLVILPIFVMAMLFFSSYSEKEQPVIKIETPNLIKIEYRSYYQGNFEVHFDIDSKSLIESVLEARGVESVESGRYFFRIKTGEVFKDREVIDEVLIRIAGTWLDEEEWKHLLNEEKLELSTGG